MEKRAGKRLVSEEQDQGHVYYEIHGVSVRRHKVSCIVFVGFLLVSFRETLTQIDVILRMPVH